ncbi:hypothetical protein BN946_scf184799.g47 [Trametes cinnabarina]|uniref:Uncharacterized protein n=1 Tax=Pycnoporus cinnabarinus TaxID=5643 RepID=A0A060S239_PYCCI|nr:hypothetical protein BN946_scf184799.g47 [Trametes cinnabarina]
MALASALRYHAHDHHYFSLSTTQLTTPTEFIMSHLLPPQEEKRDVHTTQSEPDPLRDYGTLREPTTARDTSFLVPPQEEKSGHQLKTPVGRPWMIPPQEEKADTATLRGERSVDRLEGKINQHRIEHESPGTVDERAQDRQQRDSVLSGSAGVTGEDIGYEEKSRLV